MGITLRAASLVDLPLLAQLVRAHYEAAGFAYDDEAARKAFQELVTTGRLGRGCGGSTGMEIRTSRLEVETTNARAQRAYQKAGFTTHDRALMTKRLG